ncbi:hypothetical protein DL766_010206 [Monosporascus sp. MC13-8B]|nr:hypothetical protein DL763_002715 [Monosporascus cannonballus]RYP07777.1 hypothetical protein DL766_010206 [Monosporascus sp. MC13-8B]
MPSSRFIGEVIAITGAASGIGRALALLLAAEGALLSLADVNAVALAEVKAGVLQRRPDSATDATILTTVVDVRSRKSCEEWIQATVSHFGKPIAGAANLAGQRQWNVELHARRAAAYADRRRWGRWGAIVNASSISGIMGFERNCPYVAAKHSIVGLTRTAAKEEGSNATRIEASSGSTELFGKGDPGALARKGDPEEVAEAIAFLLGPQSSFISGVVLPIDGGFAC